MAENAGNSAEDENPYSPSQFRSRHGNIEESDNYGKINSHKPHIARETVEAPPFHALLIRQTGELSVGGIAEIGKDQEDDAKNIMNQIGEREHHSCRYSQEYREDGYRVRGDAELIPDAGEEETDGSADCRSSSCG